ncbi:hypothetical protein Hanom_Chr04g00305481 [Helianthus anomalus]
MGFHLFIFFLSLTFSLNVFLFSHIILISFMKPSIVEGNPQQKPPNRPLDISEFPALSNYLNRCLKGKR